MVTADLKRPIKWTFGLRVTLNTARTEFFMDKNYELNNYESEYYQRRFPDPQEKEAVIFSTCAGCQATIHIGEEILDVYGSAVHDEYQCLKRAVVARDVIAGEE